MVCDFNISTNLKLSNFCQVLDKLMVRKKGCEFESHQEIIVYHFLPTKQKTKQQLKIKRRKKIPIIIFLLREIFTSTLADGFSLQFE